MTSSRHPSTTAKLVRPITAEVGRVGTVDVPGEVTRPVTTTTTTTGAPTTTAAPSGSPFFLIYRSGGFGITTNTVHLASGAGIGASRGTINNAASITEFQYGTSNDGIYSYMLVNNDADQHVRIPAYTMNLDTGLTEVGSPAQPIIDNYSMSTTGVALAVSGSRIYMASSRNNEAEVAFTLVLAAIDVDSGGNTTTIEGTVYDELLAQPGTSLFTPSGGTMADGHFIFTANVVNLDVRRFYAVSFDGSTFTIENTLDVPVASVFSGGRQIGYNGGIINIVGSVATYYSYNAVDGFEVVDTIDVSTLLTTPGVYTNFAIVDEYFDQALGRLHYGVSNDEATLYGLLVVEFDSVNGVFAKVGQVDGLSYDIPYPFGVYDGVIIHANEAYDQVLATQFTGSALVPLSGSLAFNGSGEIHIVPYTTGA